MPLWKQIEREEAARGKGRRGGGRPSPPPGAWRERYGVTYALDGPRGRLGIAWLIVIVAALYVGLPGVAVVFVATGAFAAYQVAEAWPARDIDPDPLIAGVGAAVIVVAGAFDVRWMGAALLVVVVLALGVAQLNARGSTLLSDAAHTVMAAGVVGIAGASVVTCLRYDDRGAAALLLAFVLVFDVGDFIVGSGSSNPIEGPLAGGMAIGAVAAVAAVLNVPPFHGTPVWWFALLAVVLCPAGQYLASAILPSARASASALRRIDSLLVLAPAWVYFVGLFIQHRH